MSTNDLTLTLVGWVATEPRHYTGAGSTPFTSFRMATTRRYFDRAQNCWVDGRTEWFTVKSWRAQALNAAISLRKSDPVLVHGRLATEEWTGPDGPRTSLVLEAVALGPDLTYGQAKFARTVHLAARDAEVAAVVPDGGDQDGAGAGDPGAEAGDGDGYPRLDDPWADDGEPATGQPDGDGAADPSRTATAAIT